MYFRNLVIPFLAIFFIIIPLVSNSALKSCRITIITSQKKEVSLLAEIADTEQTRTQGLMFRKTLARDTGMLFVFSHEKRLNFWMKNTFIPLSIAYIGKNGIINELHDMKPLDENFYPSRKAALFALEVHRGWFLENKINPGDKVIFHGCFSK